MNETVEHSDEYLTVAETAALLKVSHDTVLRHCKRGTLRALDLGTGSRHEFRVLRSSIDNLMCTPRSPSSRSRETRHRPRRRSGAGPNFLRI
ncbi:helix-turn-helix domain-containing protein [Fontivita pretiosa]|uniref:helix-turn-helix domain-containing protein n=1 Tax=Fontivita pretiosa TaxID=2989684 RepID=UPI003D17F162